ncbi:hypothetical protein LEMLEM_LOCUS8314 [Lemmus lemmus]
MFAPTWASHPTSATSATILLQTKPLLSATFAHTAGNGLISARSATTHSQ